MSEDGPGGLSYQFLGAILYAPQVQFAGAELGKRFDEIEVFALGDPEARQTGFAELPEEVGRRQCGWT